MEIGGVQGALLPTTPPRHLSLCRSGTAPGTASVLFFETLFPAFYGSGSFCYNARRFWVRLVGRRYGPLEACKWLREKPGA